MRCGAKAVLHWAGSLARNFVTIHPTRLAETNNRSIERRWNDALAVILWGGVHEGPERKQHP